MPSKPETEAQRAEAVRRAQLHSDRGQAVGFSSGKSGCKKLVVGVLMALPVVSRIYLAIIMR